MNKVNLPELTPPVRRQTSRVKDLIRRLEEEQSLSREAFITLLTDHTPEDDQYLYERADRMRRLHFGNQIYIRGLIEFSSCCKNDCLYCGLRRSNRQAQRYRLTEEEILSCCRVGYQLGYRTFVLQSGEDGWYTDERLCRLIASVKREWPDCAITLSIGEKSRESYQAYFDAGAQRYLLRHETASPAHYARLHPPEQRLETRMECLRNLKEIGYQTGCGFMVGSPGQTAAELAEDFLFLQSFRPEMVGIGPFIPHRDTPFALEPAGTADLTLFCLGLIRLMLPDVLLPATTALGTIDPFGREKGIHAGANVIMPNLSPSDVRGKYMLYDNKISAGDEAAENLAALKARMAAIGCQIPVCRGDYQG